MLNNYPIKQKNQHEPHEFDYIEYLANPSNQIENIVSKETISDVEVEMSNSFFDLRREFKRNIKRLRNFYANKRPKITAYKFQNTKSRRGSFTKKHAIG